MTHAWKQTILINEEIARTVIQSQHQLAITSICLLDQGWDNVVYLVNEHLIFRFPRREEGVVCMGNEIALLPYIKARVSFAITSPRWIGRPSDLYSQAYAGYEMIKGLPLCDAADELIDSPEFAMTLAHWLKELHATPVNPEHTAIIQDTYDWKLNAVHRTSRCEDNLNRYANYFSQAGLDRKSLQNVITRLKALQFEPSRQAYVHGDLYSRHIMVSPTNLRLTGLIDWGDIHIGHPGIDLASGMVLTKSALKLFLDTYGPVDQKTRYIMIFQAFCHGMSFLPYAFEQGKDNLKRWATLVLVRAMDELNEID